MAPQFYFSYARGLPEREAAGFKRAQEWYTGDGRGYMTQLGTKPQTIGYAFQDSPLALLAWIYEKLYDWTDEYPWTEDEILTWISMYWFSTVGPSASSFIYYEILHNHQAQEYIDLPLGTSFFPNEVLDPPMDWAKMLGPVAFQRRHDRGGHFAAWERPEDLAGDLKSMFGKGGGAHGVVKGKSGY